YAWIQPPPDEQPLAPIPEWVDAILARLAQHRDHEARARAIAQAERAEHDARIQTAARNGASVRDETATEESIRAMKYQAEVPTASEPGRYDALLSLAGKLAARGFSENAAWPAMVAFGARCDPPFSEAEMRRRTLDRRLSAIVDPSARQVVERSAPRATPHPEPEAGADPIASLAELPGDADLADVEQAVRAVATSIDTPDKLARATLRERMARELKRLNVSSPARYADAALRQADDGRQGVACLLQTPDPWDAPVDGADLCDDIAETLRRFAVLPDGAADAIALWLLHTYVFDVFEVTPRLGITSPTKQCGKTTLLALVTALAHRPLPTSNTTVAPVFRGIERYRPTLLIDEADTFLPDRAELRGVLNAGHSRAGAFVLRCEGDDHEPRVFSVWAPAAIALIGSLPDTLADRSVEIPMARKEKGDTIRRWRADRRDQFAPMRGKCVRWAADHMYALRGADPHVPDALGDRAADNWRPLLAIAELAGAGWSGRARRSALLLSGRPDADADSDRNVQLLADIRVVFDAQVGDAARITSRDLVDALVEMEDRPYPEWRGGKPMTTRGLAGSLKRFGVAPKAMRMGHVAGVRGYERAWFADAWRRYVADVGRAGGGQAQHPQQPARGAASGEADVCNGQRDVADGACARNPHEHTDVAGVADEVAGDYDAAELAALADDSPAAIASRDEDVVALFGDGHLHAPVALDDGSAAGGQGRPVDP
ncbi:hypothetical protein CMK11_16255, partial [Candidatus Poribacteria bacterium]|nr:hypothetical protein [Candidatus Poribacteria bacterium]